MRDKQIAGYVFLTIGLVFFFANMPRIAIAFSFSSIYMSLADMFRSKD